MSDTRDCDWCTTEWEGHETRPGYVQYEEDGEWVICGVCEGDAIIADVCYCCAYEPGECACNADWSGYKYPEDDELEYWEEEV